jgi:hypothetical protein
MRLLRRRLNMLLLAMTNHCSLFAISAKGGQAPLAISFYVHWSHQLNTQIGDLVSEI